jgi:hypothetical protein
MGDEQQALHYLQSALDKHDQYMASLAGDNAFRDMREQPAFKSILAGAGLSPQP